MAAMTRRRFLTILLATPLLLMMPSVWAQTDSADAQAFAAKEWKLFDAGSYAQMYDDTFDDSMKQQGKDQWVQTATSLAKQRGSMISRALGNKSSSMGIYRFIFITQCSGGKVFEDVAVTKKESTWKVVGIFIRPNLE